MQSSSYKPTAMQKDFYVYMLTNKRNGAIYKGVTSNLIKRIAEHRGSLVSGFTSKYDVKILVWYHHCETWEEAVRWEKRLRGYPRKWKLNLIEEKNPHRDDLWDEITGSHEQVV